MADATLLTLVDPMAVATVIFKASFAHITARLAVFVDRVVHRLEHITKPLDCVVLVERMVFIAAEPLIVKILQLLLVQGWFVVSVELEMTFSDFLTNSEHVHEFLVRSLLFD